MLPPVMLIVFEADVNPKVALDELLPTIFTLIEPEERLNVTAFDVENLLARFRVPPSIVNVEPIPAFNELSDPVPILKVPFEMRNKPLFVTEPACPIIVKLGLFNQIPALDGMV